MSQSQRETTKHWRQSAERDLNIAEELFQYKLRFYKKATREYALKWLEIGKKIYHDLLLHI